MIKMKKNYIAPKSKIHKIGSKDIILQDPNKFGNPTNHTYTIHMRGKELDYDDDEDYEDVW